MEDNRNYDVHETGHIELSGMTVEEKALFLSGMTVEEYLQREWNQIKDGDDKK